jgi:hypothetical protein
MKLTLQRIYSGDDCTLGVLYSETMQRLCFTLEEPWHNNERKISCVPIGKYKCIPHNSEKFRNVWRLENVPGRDGILIHLGNTVADIEGCILVGMIFGKIDGKKAVLNSKNAIRLLQGVIGQKGFDLDIADL